MYLENEKLKFKINNQAQAQLQVFNVGSPGTGRSGLAFMPFPSPCFTEF